MPDFDEDENSLANFNPRLECMDGFDVHFNKFSAEIDRDRDTTLTIASPATHPFPWQLGVRNFTDLPDC